MKLYLNKKLESIPVLSNLVTLLEGFYSSELTNGKLSSIDDIDSIRHLKDPVREFIEYYSTGGYLNLTEDRVTYITNSLYKVKGAPKIFEILRECLEIRIDYKYEFPVIDLVEFENIKLTDLPTFITKFTTALYYLLYFTEIKIHLKNFILSLQGILLQYNSGILFYYKVHKLTNVDII